MEPEPYKPLISEVQDLPFNNNQDYNFSLRTSVEQNSRGLQDNTRDLDALLRQSVEQNTRYREVLTERMTSCEEQSRTLRDMVWDKFSFLEKQYSDMKLTLLERLSQVQKENRVSVEDVTSKTEKLRADVSRSEVCVLPQLEEDMSDSKQKVSAIEERLMAVQKDLESYKVNMRSEFDTTALKSDLINLTTRQDDANAQLLTLVKQRLNHCEQKFQDDRNELFESLDTVRTASDALKQRIVEVRSNIGEQVSNVREELETTDAALKDELEGARRELEELVAAQFTMLRDEVKEQSEVTEEMRRTQRKEQERLSEAQLAFAHTKGDMEKQLAAIKVNINTDINRVILANQGAIAGVEKSMDQFRQCHHDAEKASVEIMHQLKALERELSELSASVSTVKIDLGQATRDITLHRAQIGEALQKEIQLERANAAQWTERVVELQNMVGHLQERMDSEVCVENVFAEQIQRLQEALETTGLHTEGRLQRIEKVVQALRLQSDIEHTLQEVKLGVSQ